MIVTELLHGNAHQEDWNNWSDYDYDLIKDLITFFCEKGKRTCRQQ